jgi:hypothetical protein
MAGSGHDTCRLGTLLRGLGKNSKKAGKSRLRFCAFRGESRKLKPNMFFDFIQQPSKVVVLILIFVEGLLESEGD